MRPWTRRMGLVTVLLLALPTVVGITRASASEHSTVASATCPPPGFDPLTASATSLLHYGFPRRPSDPVGAASWTYAMRNALNCVAAPTQTSTVRHPLRLPKDHATYIWAGYVIPYQDAGGQHITAAYSEWVQPSVPANSSYPNWQTAPAASFWSGMGLNYIIQSGCDSIAASTATYKCWWEDYPGGSNYGGPSLSPGNLMYDAVQYQNNDYTNFFIENISTQKYTSYTHEYTPYVGWADADFINEMVGPSLPDYGSTAFSSPNEGCNTSCYLLSASNGIKYTMSNGTYPGAISSNTFYVYWR
jgi:hypothetical protein